MKRRKVTSKRATKRGISKRKSTRRSTRRKSMLSEFFTPAAAQGGMKTIMSAAVGAIAGQAINKMLPNQTVNARAGVKLLGGFLMATVGKMPNLGAGLSAVGVTELIQQSGFLAEGGMNNTRYADPIEALPAMLNDNGQPMYLADNGAMYLSDAPMYLAENDLSYDVGYYGAGFGLDNMDI
jgi:hypothetical protein